ncbi:ABC transporter substrate-binding protein [Streptomyces longispororuber]|uniref:ABC transporter substrate-binding protein n=1 Tax=Streptomyces longispororuber TaxID=68230 RepID=UPI00210AAA61|nr:ABC transporter substrate-binding protein [Streptomyces longispororuber]MCQ4211125.1 ABC transporter substrate-binding protein [Streptomyces longispororuber]
MGSSHARRSAATAAALATLLALSGCASGSVESDGKITLTVATFSDFGYKPLIKEYEKAHPDIVVKERISQLDQHHNSLSTQLSSGSGAADVVAIEEGYLPKFRTVQDKFVNLAASGGLKRKDEYLPYKWAQGTTDGGKFVMGYGTDVGGLAICYRKDLFRRAGLPTDREAVGRLWPTWDAYFKAGDTFRTKVKDHAWFDSAGNVFSAMMNQTEYGFFDADDSYIADENPDVKRSFSASADAAADGMSANLVPFSQQWNAGIKQGRMATITCPAWMTGLIQTAAGKEGEGKWDIASVPGGGGNWGGSFLTVPKQGRHTKEAADLAAFLTSADSEKKIFQGPTGSLPSLTGALSDPAVQNTRQKYFDDAPTGKIFAASAQGLKPSYRGTKDQQVRIPFANALQLVEQRKSSPAQAWQKALSDAAKNLKH